MEYKVPESVLVVIHTMDLQVLVMERTDKKNYWQSVTGSKNGLNEPFSITAEREVKEETGLDAKLFKLIDWQLENIYDIYPIWLYRYAPGITKNREHVFGLTLPHTMPILLAEREHRQYKWLPYRDAADLCFSTSNAEAILQLPERILTSS
ncbi:MAG: dihydroneopterin triphosphate diphosphatase [Solimicrobium sp.]|jgi:dATP pyrophosphohydrolase|nr:dihydroneopterin triphosphate diphosphatase [Solimicrobium sp.]